MSEEFSFVLRGRNHITFLAHVFCVEESFTCLLCQIFYRRAGNGMGPSVQCSVIGQLDHSGHPKTISRFWSGFIILGAVLWLTGLLCCVQFVRALPLLHGCSPCAGACSVWNKLIVFRLNKPGLFQSRRCVFLTFRRASLALKLTIP